MGIKKEDSFKEGEEDQGQKSKFQRDLALVRMKSEKSI